ncbi:hypothetical protein [Carnobacterium maltaromaticum]|uniref:hypothetical protein n=1 Tax=Carnobacterium maltaromaticum TaxID=2751 RepID=UPI0039AFE2D8
MEKIEWNEQVIYIPFFKELPTWLIKGFSDDFAKVTKKGFSMSSEQAERAFKNCARQAQLFLYQDGKTKMGLIDWNITAFDYLNEFKQRYKTN